MGTQIKALNERAVSVAAVIMIWLSEEEFKTERKN